LIKLVSSGRSQWLLLIIGLVVCIFLVVYDIQYLRQISAFFTFLIFPGWLILKIGSNRLEFWEKVILSVGLSTAYLMFMGVAVNWIFFDLGFKAPLSLTFLLPASVAGVAILAFIAWSRNPAPIKISAQQIKILFREPLLLLSLLFPILAVLGAYLMNTYNNNYLVLGVYVGIAVYVALLTLTQQRKSFVYSTACWAIGLALLLIYSMRSEHILGYDIHSELLLFQKTLATSYWDVSSITSPINACLSVVILPPVIQSLININSEYIYKIVYALIYSITPVAIYFISAKYINSRLAFLASFFFVSQATFATASQSNPRTAIALVFFALFLFVLFSKNLNKVSKIIFSLIFIAALIVSHYSTAYIFFMLLLGGFVAGYLGKNRLQERGYVISLGLVLISVILIFIWYAQVSDANFKEGVRVVECLLRSMGSFFIEESRHQGTLKVMGVGAKSIGDILFSASHYLVALIIATGLTCLIYTRAKGIRLKVLSEELENEHLGMLILSAAILAAMILMPVLSREYTADRLWTQAMVLLSLPFILGICAIAGNRRKTLNLLLLTVLLFHLANSNYLVYQATGESRSLVFNSFGPEYAHFFVHETEILSSKWMVKEMRPDSQVYSDFDGAQRFYSGPVKIGWNGITFFMYRPPIGLNDYVYLGYNNVVLDKIYTGFETISTKSVKNLLINESEIYDNGGSRVYG